MATSTEFVEAQVYRTFYLDHTTRVRLRFYKTELVEGAFVTTPLDMTAGTVFDSGTVKLLVATAGTVATAEHTFTGTVQTADADLEDGIANAVEFDVLLAQATDATVGESARQWHVQGQISTVKFIIGRPRQIDVYDLAAA